MQPLKIGPDRRSFARPGDIVEDAIMETFATKQQPKAASTPRKYADPKKKHKRKLAEKSKRKNRR